MLHFCVDTNYCKAFLFNYKNKSCLYSLVLSSKDWKKKNIEETQ